MGKRVPSAFLLLFLFFANSCANVPASITGQVNLSSNSFISSQKAELTTNTNINTNIKNISSQISTSGISNNLNFSKESNDLTTSQSDLNTNIDITSGFKRVESNTVVNKVVQKTEDFSLSVKKTLGNIDVSNISDVEFANKIENLIFEKTNKERVKRGLEALKIDKNLAKMARIHNNNMLKKSFFSHTDQFGMEPTDRKDMFYPNLLGSVGENILYLKGMSSKSNDEIANELFKDWMNSSEHKENILSLDFTHIGVGVVVDGEKVYATQDFSDEQALLTDSNIPQEVNSGEELSLNFKFVGNFDKNALSIYVEFPNENEKFYVTEHQYYLGYGEYKPTWEGGDTFKVTFKFDKGKGLYKIRTGKNNSFYDESIKIVAN